MYNPKKALGFLFALVDSKKELLEHFNSFTALASLKEKSYSLKSAKNIPYKQLIKADTIILSI